MPFIVISTFSEINVSHGFLNEPAKEEIVKETQYAIILMEPIRISLCKIKDLFFFL